MKKLILGSMIAVAAVFAAPVFAQKAPAVPANTASLLKLIPADSQFAFSGNGSAIVNSKFLNKLAEMFAQKTITALLQENGVNADDMNSVTVGAVKFIDVKKGKVEVTGATKYSRNNAEKLFDNMVKESKEELAKEKEAVTLKEIKVDGRKAITLNGVKDGYAFSALIIQASPDTIQFRIGVGEGVVPAQKLVPFLGTPCKLAASLNLKSAFSIALNMENVMKLMSTEEAQNNPMLAGLSVVALTVEEVQDAVKAKLDITTSTVDAAPMYQMQAAQMLEMCKQDPNTKAFADAVTMKLDANVLTIQASFPTAMLMEKIVEAQKAAAAPAPAAEPAPAAAPAPAPAPAK